MVKCFPLKKSRWEFLKKSSNMKKSGDIWEIQAIEYLKSKGYTIVETNFRFWKVGEIDIVWKIGGIIVFFEVKKRFWNSMGYAVEALNFWKKIKILKTIEYYCMMRKISLEQIRFDFLAIQDGKIEHFENVELY